MTAQPGRPEMTIRAIEPAQHTAARIVGLLYLLLMVTGMFAEFFARGQLIVAGDAVQTARNIAESERLFRMGVVSNLITFAGDVALAVALYVVLRPVSNSLALVATFWRLVESAVLGVTAFFDFAALVLLSGADYLRVFDTEQLQALARAFISVQGAGYRIGLVFLGLGSIVFAYLWFKSRYIPRALSGLGIFASLLLTIVSLGIMVFPKLAPVVTPLYFAPMFFFEVGLGLWLLIKGIRAPIAQH